MYRYSKELLTKKGNLKVQARTDIVTNINCLCEEPLRQIGIEHYKNKQGRYWAEIVADDNSKAYVTIDITVSPRDPREYDRTPDKEEIIIE